MSIIDFSQKILELDGSEIDEKGASLTLGNVVAAACGTGIPDGKLPSDNPLRAGELAMTLYSAKSFSVDTKDILLIQNRLPFRWVPSVQFQAHEMLENGEPEKKPMPNKPAKKN